MHARYAHARIPHIKTRSNAHTQLIVGTLKQVPLVLHIARFTQNIMSKRQRLVCEK